jgi:mycothiol synthase
MITQTMFKARAYAGDKDAQAICDLLNACEAVDKLDETYTAEDLRLEFQSPELDVARDLRLWEDDAGRLVGFGQVWIPKTGETVDGFSYILIHPDIRNAGLEGDVVGWLTERLREAAQERGLPAKLYGRTRDYNAYGRGIFENNGFQIVRYGYRMARSLHEPIPEPQFPEGFTLRHSQGIEDAERWVEMFNQSFIDHWNHHPITVEAHKHWLTDPKYDNRRDLIAVAPDGTFAAFCFCGIDPDDNARNNRKDGWIHILGTRRGYRRIGLGRAMLLAGLRKLKEEGMDTAKLGVDAENPTGALGLYESTGFQKITTSVSYCKDL